MSKRIFSESFKRDKVRLYETGKMSVAAISKLYAISETAIYKWIDKYRSTPAAERIVVETDSDYLQLRLLEERIEKMERLIGTQQIELDYWRSVIAAASDHYGEDVKKSLVECGSSYQRFGTQL